MLSDFGDMSVWYRINNYYTIIIAILLAPLCYRILGSVSYAPLTVESRDVALLLISDIANANNSTTLLISTEYFIHCFDSGNEMMAENKLLAHKIRIEKMISFLFIFWFFIKSDFRSSRFLINELCHWTLALSFFLHFVKHFLILSVFKPSDKIERSF